MHAMNNNHEMPVPRPHHIAQRMPDPRPTLAQFVLATGLWVGILLLALVFNPNISWQAELPDIVFLSLMYILSVVLALRLPMGIYVGLGSPTLLAAVLTLGYERALLIGVVGTLVATLMCIALRPWLGLNLPFRHTMAIEVLGQGATATFSLLPTGWLYLRMVGPDHLSLTRLQDLPPFLLFAISHFLLMSTFLAIWLVMNRQSVRAYWRHYWRPLAANNFMLLLFAPLIDAVYRHWQHLHLLQVALHTVSASLLYWINDSHFSLAQRVADLRTLSSVGQALSANLELKDLLKAIYSEVGKLFDLSGFYLALYDEKEQLITFPIGYETGQPSRLKPRPMGNGLTEYVLRTRQPLVLNYDALKAAQKMGIEPVRGSHDPPLRSYLGVPIRIGGQIAGVMALRSFSSTYAHTEKDVQVLETIAAQVGAALHNAHLYQERRDRAEELASLNEISQLLSTSLELDTVIHTVCATMVSILRCPKAVVFLLEEDGETLRLAGSIGLSESFQAQAAQVDVSEDRAEVVRTGRLVFSEDIMADAYYSKYWDMARDEGFYAWVDLPLRIGEQIIGSLTAYYDQPHHFDHDEFKLMEMLGGQIAAAVQNARLFEATRARSRELESLYEAGQAINASLSLKTVLQAVAVSIIRALEIEKCVALLIREDRMTLGVELSTITRDGGIREAGEAQVEFLLSGMPSVEEHIHRQKVVALDSEDEPDQHQRELLQACGLRSAIFLPLMMHGDPLGLLLAGTHSHKRTFGPEQLRLGEAIAVQAAAAIENAWLFERTDVALARRLDELAALETIAQRMTRQLDLHDAIDLVIQAAVETTGAEFGEVALLDEHSRTLNAIALRGTEPEGIEEYWSADWGLTGHALRIGKALLIDDVSQDPHYMAAREGIRSEMVAPIILDNKRLGVVNLESLRPAAFTRDHLRFVTNLAEHAAVAIQNAQLFETVQRQVDKFNTLRSVAVELLSSSNVKEALQIIARGILEQAQAQAIYIYLCEEDDGTLSFGTSLWADGTVDHQVPFHPNGMTITVARSGERVIVTDISQAPAVGRTIEAVAQSHPIESAVGVPIKHRGKVIGVLHLALAKRQDLSEDLLHFLDLMAAQAAVAIQNARLSEQIRAGRDRLQAILNSSHDGIMMLDPKGRLVTANPRAEWLLNVKAGKYIGWHFMAILKDVIGLLGPEAPGYSLREARDFARKVGETPKEVTRREYFFTHPTPRVIEEISSAVISQEGEMLGRLFLLRDITQDHELKSYQQEMSHMIVHDLRSPLASIISGLHMALEELSTASGTSHFDDLQTTLDTALGSANVLLRLIETILDLNKLEAEEIPLVLEPIHLKEMAERAYHILRQEAELANIEVIIEAPDDLPHVMADAEKIERVFLNLLDNSLHYTPERGRIRIIIEVQQAAQMVSITDTGEGIPPEHRERIFERFIQVDAAKRLRGSKGSGLGLAFCRLAIDLHKGRIWADEGPEGGAAFHFSLPTDLDASDLKRS